MLLGGPSSFAPPQGGLLLFLFWIVHWTSHRWYPICPARQDEEKQSLLAELMKDAACRALEDIRTVLDDDRLDDKTCFWRIEEIVKIYKKMGSNGGSRHDF